MSFLYRLYSLLFPDEDAAEPKNPLYHTIQELQRAIVGLQERLTKPPPLLNTILNPGERVYHMLRTVDNEEHVASAEWVSETQTLRSLDDVEAGDMFTNLSAFGEHHYKTTPNNRKSTSCKGFKECYVIREGKRIQLYELLP